MEKHKTSGPDKKSYPDENAGESCLNMTDNESHDNRNLYIKVVFQIRIAHNLISELINHHKW